MIKIAIQGIRGCFHDEVASALYKDYDLVECRDFHEVFSSVESGKADIGIAAIENTLQGSINQTYRLLARSKLMIVGEHYLDVKQYLIGIRDVSLTNSNEPNTKIYSMFPSFAQTERWLDEHLPQAERVEYFDNAASVKKIMSDGLSSQLAIAGKHAANEYGASVLAGPINDDAHNTTRFFVLAREGTKAIKGADKTSIILTTNHTPGSLYRALGAFDAEAINLLKLASYPIPGDDWHYMFYTDFDQPLHSDSTVRVLDNLTKQGCTIRILGSYKGRK